MKTKRTLTIAAAVVALAASITFSALRGPSTAKAQDTVPPPIPDRISFPMVGITQGQTIRVNVSNVTTADDSSYPPGPTRVAIIVVNSHGDPIRNRDGSPVRRVVQLDRGESAFLDLDADDFPSGPSRLQLRAVIVAQPPPVRDSKTPPPVGERIVSSVEIFNANGRTVVFIGNPGVIRGFNPQPDPPL